MLRPSHLVLLVPALGACLPPLPLPALTPAQEAAVRSTVAATATPRSSISIPPRPCPEHSARPEPGEKCRPLPCGGLCREDQRCDEAAIVPSCVPR